MSITIDVKGLVKKFPRFKLEIEKLNLSEGIHVIIGPNGSGKTVFLKLLSGLLRPSRGKIIYNIDGKLLDSTEVLPYTSIVTTDIVLPNLKIRDLIKLYISLQENDLNEIAKRFYITHVMEKKYEELSSGYKKRVQLAIALSLPTRIVLLDEPFINVDTKYISYLEELISSTRNKLIVLSTHVISKLLRNNIILLENGRITYHGTIPRIIEKMVEIKLGNHRVSLDKIIEDCIGENVDVKIFSILEAVSRFNDEKVEIS